MTNQRRKLRSFISYLLIVTIILCHLALPGFSQEKPIIISFGQPNIWSLEQAHYLLERMHRENLDLQTKSLGDLDPNEVNASRIDILKTLLEVGVKFDEAAGINNSLLKKDKEFNSGRRQELLQQHSTLLAESTQLSREVAELKIAKTQTEKEEEKKQIQEQIDAKTEEKAAVDNQLKNVDEELKGLTSASGNFTSAAPTEGFDFKAFPQSALDDLIKSSVKDFSTKSTIAASQRLDNHIQMQYEIISKQLTLLRDEVGPGERLVFLELPQSINTSQDRAENKVVQTWWRISGYTKVNKAKLFDAELENLGKNITDISAEIKGAKLKQFEFNAVGINLSEQLTKLCDLKKELLAILAQKKKELECNKKQDKPCVKETNNDEELSSAAKPLDDECKGKESMSCTQIVNDIERLCKAIGELNKTIERTQQAIQSQTDQQISFQKDTAKLSEMLTALSVKYNRLKLEKFKNKIREQQEISDRLLQGGAASTTQTVKEGVKTMVESKPDKFNDLSNWGPENKDSKSIKERDYISLEIPETKNISGEQSSKAQLRNRGIRTIDIIPRQNAVNVNDTKERVNATGIVAAFSFIFGFGGNVRYQRQREQFEQFLNQELYTSGFGKGESDFGWNFYPFARTKQVAPGVRTTYAVAIIPDDAESIVLKARGCYLPRKDFLPLSYDAASNWNTGREQKNSNCSEQEQAFVIPVPGGNGNGGDFYVTGLWYSPYLEKGSRMVASIYGQNLSPQMGVLINGVPLREAIGLAQTNVESILQSKVVEQCDGDICGRFERIDSNQMVVSFKMGANFQGTPRITLVAPGKAVEINNLHLNVNGTDDAKLDESEKMFGKPPEKLARVIADLKVAPDPVNPLSQMIGVLTGESFDKSDTIFINGQVVKASGISCTGSDLCIFPFRNQRTDFLTVTISPSEPKLASISKTFANPAQLKIVNTSIVDFKKATATEPAVLTVKLEGAGFSTLTEATVKQAASVEIKLVPTSGQMILEIKSPGPVIEIILTDKKTNYSISTLVAPYPGS